ncbi:phage holin family protein [Salegentibacter sp. F188]|uniref:Phage holin family protein n=1 Tax=Autumnicola patrickiae TaxID=3075591 RepID=A0ABU3E5H3_9FLAO|nr:phage holin family protein [Salegentibacter sp. F188]MDT0690462.1 phage holin family protein [Salegentibacter sp. F188]
MAFEKLSESIEELKGNIKSYSKSNAEYFKLKAFKGGVKGVTAVVNLLLIFFFGVFALIFLSIAGAVAISAALDSPSAGFWIVGGFYLLLVILILLLRKKIGQFILTKASESFFK